MNEFLGRRLTKPISQSTLHSGSVDNKLMEIVDRRDHDLPWVKSSSSLSVGLK